VTTIVGGGPAGAAAAIHLARAGAPVTLIERTAGPHDKVCGDFLGGPALAFLTDLGIDPAALGAAPITHVRLIAGARSAAAPLPFPACGLSRRVLDEALLAAAAGAGAGVSRGETVRGLRAAGRRIALDYGAGVLAETVLLATGKHDLRGAPRPAHGHGAVGLKMYVTLAPEQAAALAGVVEMVLLSDGYAGLQSVEAGRAVLCVMRRRDRMGAGGQSRLLQDLTAASPHLRRRLADAVPAGDRPVAVAGVPYGHLHRPAPDSPAGLFRLGDQAAVIPSLTGEGIAVALSSAALAARCVLAGVDSEAYHHRLSAALRRPMRMGMLAHRAAAAPPAQPWLLRICQMWPGVIGFTATQTRC
jgi:menaquinone-9 beta-reductase